MNWNFLNTVFRIFASFIIATALGGTEENGHNPTSVPDYRSSKIYDCQTSMGWLAERKIIRPIINSVNPNQIKKFIEAHPSKMRPLVSFFAKHIRHISQPEFESASERSANLFFERNPELANGKPFIIFTLKGKSNAWTTSLLLAKRKLFPPQAKYILFEGNSNDLMLYLSDHPDIQNLVIADDGAYSGTQLRKIKESVLEADNAENLHVHFLVPYITNYAYREISNESGPFSAKKRPTTKFDHFYEIERLATVAELLAKPEVTASMRKLARSAYTIGSIKDEERTLFLLRS